MTKTSINIIHKVRLCGYHAHNKGMGERERGGGGGEGIRLVGIVFNNL